jgi:hypothetical protein
MKIAMALVIASPPVFYILETMWTVAFQVLGRILIATTFRRTRHQAATMCPVHYATNPNNTRLDNFGTRGNTNSLHADGAYLVAQSKSSRSL